MRRTSPDLDCNHEDARVRDYSNAHQVAGNPFAGSIVEKAYEVMVEGKASRKMSAELRSRGTQRLGAAHLIKNLAAPWAFDGVRGEPQQFIGLDLVTTLRARQ